MTLNRLPLAFFLSLIPFSVPAQQAPAQNAQAVTLATQALAALSGTTQVSDITLVGSATRTAGSDIETGAITLKALGNQDSRFDLVMTSGTRSEIRNVSRGTAQGSWVTPDGVSHAMATHNTFSDAAWFVPALSILSQLSNPNLIVSYIGQETRSSGESVQHLHFAFQSASDDPTGLLQGLSAEEIYLDASTFLPVALAFNTHSDNNAGANIPVEIDFSNYQQVNGVQIPFHVQKYLNGTLFLDVTVQSAVLNSGLQPSDF
jgi:hypothetical protein